MSLFRTLLWRESRDHRAWTLAAFGLWPFMLAGLQLLLDRHLPSDAAALAIVPLLVLLFSAFLGAEIFAREAETKVAQSFARLPLSPTTLYLAKLTFFVSMTVLIDVWLLTVESIRLLATGGDALVFLSTSLDGIGGHAAAFLIGLGSFALATWMRQSLTAVLASFTLIIGVPSLLFKMTPLSLLLAGAGPISGFSIGVWWGIAALTLAAAGLMSCRLRGGLRFDGARRAAAFVGGALAVVGFASTASAGQWILQGRRLPLHISNPSSAVYSPDGSRAAILVYAERPGLGTSLGLWDRDFEDLVARGSDSSTNAAPASDQYWQGLWIYDLASGERIQEIEGFTWCSWESESLLAVSWRMPDGLTVKRAHWDLELKALTEAPTYEPHKLESTLYSMSGTSRNSQDMFIRNTDGANVVPLGQVQDGLWLRNSKALLFMTASGDLKLHDLNDGLPGTTRLIAESVSVPNSYMVLSSDDSEVVLMPRHTRDEPVFASSLTYIDIQTGERESGPEGDYVFAHWTWNYPGNAKSKRLFRKLGAGPMGNIYVTGQRGLFRIETTRSDLLTGLPNGGFLLGDLSEDQARMDLVLLDENGERGITLDRFRGQ